MRLDSPTAKRLSSVDYSTAYARNNVSNKYLHCLYSTYYSKSFRALDGKRLPWYSQLELKLKTVRRQSWQYAIVLTIFIISAEKVFVTFAGEEEIVKL